MNIWPKCCTAFVFLIINVYNLHSTISQHRVSKVKKQIFFFKFKIVPFEQERTFLQLIAFKY
ncbi:hypothetical protein Hdeb2414_s0008g00281161 [Helianthus debilis subsp. tardiflorus]